MTFRRLLNQLVFALASLLLCSACLAKDGILIAAAANTQFALTEIAQRWAQEGHEKPRLVFGATAQLAQQIKHGATFELFLAADEDTIKRLSDEKTLPNAGVPYAEGHLVLVLPTGSTLLGTAPLTNSSLKAVLQSPEVKKIAIANPDLAPYGLAAKQVFKHLGLALDSKLVVAENISQAAQFVATGNAALGFTAGSLLATGNLKDSLQSYVIDAALYQPIVQRMAATSHASAEALQFYDFILSPRGQEILRRFGYQSPAQKMP